MIKKFDTYNESLRDKMTPKSDEEIQDAINNMSMEDYEFALLKAFYPYNRFNKSQMMYHLEKRHEE